MIRVSELLLLKKNSKIGPEKYDFTLKQIQEKIQSYKMIFLHHTKLINVGPWLVCTVQYQGTHQCWLGVDKNYTLLYESSFRYQK